jgi:photosystem II stability/assembly factor-like uncharacterized protein
MQSLKISFLIFILSITLFAQVNWTSQPIPDGSMLLISIDFSGSDTGFSGGWDWGQTFDVESAGVYTTNGGTIWESSLLPDSTRAIIYSKIFNNSTGIAAAAYNYNVPSNVNLAQQLNSLYDAKNFTQISYSSIGYVREAETGGVILRTTDAGKRWNTITVLPDSFKYIYGAYFIDENIGFIIAPTESLTHILKTTDGGFSWQIKFTFPPVSASRSIVFSSALNGIAVGYNLSNIEQGIVAVTNDGGESWTYQFITQAGNLAVASFSDENTFYATGQNFQNGCIFKSTNAGTDWFQTSFQSTEFFLDGINFLEGTDAGFVFGKTLLNPLQIFFIKTDNGGNVWSKPEFIGDITDYFVFGSEILDENNVYLSGGNYTSSGLILKTSDAALPVESDLFKTPVEFALEQNFPNPFNPFTKLNYSITQSGLVTLKVYDVLGTEIETLVNEEKSSGTYELNWNATNLPSGIYFYQLKAGNYINTKKMILLK